MYAVTRITLWDKQGRKFFGEGPCRLLRRGTDRFFARGVGFHEDGLHQGAAPAEKCRSRAGLSADHAYNRRQIWRRQYADRAGKGVAGKI